MADLRTVCIEGFCSDVPEYTAGQNITITDENVINAIVDLSNYYNKAEVNNLIDGLTNARIEVVQELPQTGETNVIYLVPKEGGQGSNVYNEYVYASNAWEKIGDTEIDLSDYVTTEQMNNALATKQDKLTAGANVQINGNTISATDTKYTAGTNVSISNSNVISAVDTKYSAGTNISISSGNVISATDTKYTASDANPLMDGTATPGTSAKYAREGHRHPTDTTRAPLASPALTGTPTAPTAAAGTNNTQIATTAMVQAAINRRLPKSTTWFYSSTESVSVPNNSEQRYLVYTTPAAGTIIGHMFCRYIANATGTRMMAAKYTNNYIGMASENKIQASASGTTCVVVPVTRHFGANVPIYMVVLQTSGGALNINERYFHGMWIPD